MASTVRKSSRIGKNVALHFQNLFLLREHTRIQHTHKDRKPYKCGHCDFRAHTSGNCRKHCQANHRGEWVGRVGGKSDWVLAWEGQLHG